MERLPVRNLIVLIPSKQSGLISLRVETAHLSYSSVRSSTWEYPTFANRWPINQLPHGSNIYSSACRY